jgi:hypothetical protein
VFTEVLIAAFVAWLIIKSRAASSSLQTQPSVDTSNSGESLSEYTPTDALTESWAQIEGFFTPGTLAQRLNNPVNIHGNWPGVIGHTSTGEAIFSDPSFGWGAAETYAQQQAQAHLDWSFQNFFAKVLGNLKGQPVNNDQGNSNAEAGFVAAQLGIDPGTNLADYIAG